MVLTYVILYAILAAAVVLLSIKLADYVDLIDKKSNLSGAFIGGVILAAVTSLPELFTSITAVTIVKQPQMVIGNILGSNIFNMTVLGVLIIFTSKCFNKSVIGKSHTKTALFTLLLFVLMLLPVFFDLDYKVYHVSIYSIIIIVLYALSIRFMAGDESSEDSEDKSNLTIKQVVIRFIIVAILLVGCSIAITYVTDKLANELNLAASLAGALFLGIATSLPELTSCIALVKKGNYNACVGNILGSGIFNFFIISVSDIIYIKDSIFAGASDSKALSLFGLISVTIVSFILILKNKLKSNNGKTTFIYWLSGVAITACYILFIVMS